MNEPHKKPTEAETDTAPQQGTAPDGKGHTAAEGADNAASSAETAAEQGGPVKIHGGAGSRLENRGAVDRSGKVHGPISSR